MQREIQLTADGSHTVSIPEMKVTYHSMHGAVQESMHVFIEAGLLPLLNNKTADPVYILEIGFGTGLNALLSLREAIRCRQKIVYLSIEPYPLSDAEITLLNHGTQLGMAEAFMALHEAEWEKELPVHPFFSFHKTKKSLQDFSTGSLFHGIYFDVFAPVIQPDLWTEPIFSKLYQLLMPGGCLLTYCSKSIVRKAMTTAGFDVEKIPGPFGKREMVRAWKPVQ